MTTWAVSMILVFAIPSRPHVPSSTAKDLIPTFSYVLTELRDRYPKLAYIHLITPRVAGSEDRVPTKSNFTLDFARKIWNEKENVRSS